MDYFIKSIKWTKYNKKETWYRSNESGYTNFICSAGVYNEEDKVRMSHNGNIEFVPISEKLIKKGKRQVQKVIKINEEEVKRRRESYEEYIIKNRKRMLDLEENINHLDNLEYIGEV